MNPMMFRFILTQTQRLQEVLTVKITKLILVILGPSTVFVSMLALTI